MPKPLYILCSQSGAIDRITGLVSHFNVYDGLALSLTPGKPGEAPVLQALTMQIVAAWIRSEDDLPDTDYEHQLAIRFPWEAEEQILASGTMRFPKRRHRFTFSLTINLELAGPPPSGVIRIENRLRRVGDAEWLTQIFPLDVDVHTAPADGSTPQENLTQSG